jgi:hypothetical protein
MHRAIWTERSTRLGSAVRVTDCAYTAGELAELRSKGRQVSYLPPGLATQPDRHHLARIFPSMRSFALIEGNAFTNDVDWFGWFDYDPAIDAPNVDTTEAGAIETFAGGTGLMNLNAYVVASQDSHELCGAYLDERRTWARLGSRLDGRMIAARFDGREVAEGLGNEIPVDGSLLIAYDVEATDHGHILGVRSLGRPAAADDDRERIVDELVRLGFASELGMSAAQYRQSIPETPDRPRDDPAAFGMLLVVDPRIPWRRQAELAGISLSAGSRETDYRAVSPRHESPQSAYVAWFNDWHRRFPNPVSPADARSALRDDEVGGSPFDLVALQIAHPELAEAGRFYEAIGFGTPDVPLTGVASGTDALRAPCIFHWRGRPELGANLHPAAFSIFRPLVRAVTDRRTHR